MKILLDHFDWKEEQAMAKYYTLFLATLGPFQTSCYCRAEHNS